MSVSQKEKGDSTSTDPFVPSGFLRLVEGEFHARLAASAGVAVVLFSAPQCGACRAWKQLLPQALAEMTGVFYEVDVSEATGVARSFGIFHLPTVYLYRNGHFHGELQCEARLEAIQCAAHNLLAGPPQEEP